MTKRKFGRCGTVGPRLSAPTILMASCLCMPPKVIAYDIVPPLQYVGKDAYRRDYEEFLAQYEGPIETEFRSVSIVAGNNVAFIHSLERISGTLKSGQKSEVWVRATSGLRKINGKWLIRSEEHTSELQSPDHLVC